MSKTNKYTPRLAVYQALISGLVMTAVLTVLSAIVWTAWKGMPGLWGVLVGAAIGAGFVLFTAVIMVVTGKLPDTTMAAVLMGSWLLKIVVLMGVLAVLKTMHFYDRYALAVTVLLALVFVLGAEVRGVLKTKTVYVEPAGEA